MRFIKASRVKAAEAISSELAGAISCYQHVLWLTSGGSLIPIQTQVMHMLAAKPELSLQRLAIWMIDERYGAPGHENSNYAQLRADGFRPGAATHIDILNGNLTLDKTLDRYSNLAETSFANADYIIATCGLGADGHTAGLMPGWIKHADEHDDVVSYTTPNFTRLTLTPRLIKKCHAVFVCAYGPQKQEALQRLSQPKIDSSIPAHFYASMPDVRVYNDKVETKDAA